MSGYKEWIDNAEINIDYYSAFLKAWIAFNAWYNYEINEKTDQRCIEKNVKIVDSNHILLIS